jgi:deoxyadenosine/deoxycytidine kinase
MDQLRKASYLKKNEKVSVEDADVSLLPPAVKQINVVVEGSIGAGKSTLIKYMKELDKAYNKIEFYEEPVDQWMNFQGHNLLQEFYKDPKENAFALQSYINLTKVKQFVSKTNKPIRLFERSLASSQKCFMPILFKNELLSAKETDILKSWADTLSEWFPNQLKIDKVIYLQTNPDKCLERISQRNRSEESNISYEYLVDLHKAHETWISQLSDAEIDVIGVNVSLDFEVLKPTYQQIYQDLCISVLIP